ncbi:hypothetical protein BKM03_15550 [Pseudomonas avellanae]|uniref:Uncharacterized protein n=1 Tax=Pseudomonas avellanae TaxID=46257 RepID=A0AAD0E1H6_9PSED|nr:hypothetical protein BKM03_15550 [Pseudomonas avellanae]POP85804.1 hypothetical protein CXB34_15355 [Pseudomonas amygdali pv. morsprunorum]
MFGCETPWKPATSVAPDVPCAPVLLPVPGSSRTSPLLRKSRKRRPVRCYTRLWERTCPRRVAKRP